jgi:hypothetical protein
MLIVDAGATMSAIKEMMSDNLVRIRSEKEIAELVQRAAQTAGAMQGGQGAPPAAANAA